MTVRLTGGSTWSRGRATLPSVLALEILAQAAVAALPAGAAGSGGGLLAGIDHARFDAPLCPADTLVATVAIERRFGQLIKVRGELKRQDSNAPVASASLYLALTS